MSDPQIDTIKYICLDAGSKKYAGLGLDTRWVAAVQPLTGLSLAEKHGPVYGHLEWNKQQVAVYRLDTILGRAESRLSRDQRILIINSQPNLGILVEQTPQESDAPVENITMSSGALRLEHEQILEGVLTTEAGLIMLLEPTRLQRVLYGRHSEPCWPLPHSETGWRAVSMVERAQARLRASMSLRSGLQLVIFQALQTVDPNLIFALSLSQVIEVDAPENFVKSPLPIPGLHGLGMWRGWPIPILNWQYMIGIDSPDDAKEREMRLLVCVDARGDFAGLLVGAEVETIRLPRVKYDDEIGGLFPDRIAGSYRYKDERLILLDLNQLISEPAQTEQKIPWN